ncbi:MAG: 3-demethylubiquinone-9 3-methyltransferase family protein [Verrucomicrobia bacterium]|nr:3-demethylubiquinone-9 3-methyltransferase family protein [Verrucomicrobiota bacterium]
MKASIQTIVPCLWFNDNGEEAARFYAGIFKNSKITAIARYTDAGKEHHGHKEGDVMTVEFQLAGQTFVALNGGPHFKFNEAISLQVMCDTQAQVDHYWDKLKKGGDSKAQMCGWLKDRFGVSWQIVPRMLPALMLGKDPDKRQRAMAAMMKMKKLNISALKRAAGGSR